MKSKDENKLIELLESKPFDSLSIAEKEFVSALVSEDEYRLHSLSFADSKEDQILPNKDVKEKLDTAFHHKHRPSKNRYYTLVSVLAAASILAFVFFTNKVEDVNSSDEEIEEVLMSLGKLENSPERIMPTMEFDLIADEPTPMQVDD